MLDESKTMILCEFIGVKLISRIMDVGCKRCSLRGISQYFIVFISYYLKILQKLPENFLFFLFFYDIFLIMKNKTNIFQFFF